MALMCSMSIGGFSHAPRNSRSSAGSRQGAYTFMPGASIDVAYGIVDLDDSVHSRKLAAQLDRNSSFRLQQRSADPAVAREQIPRRV